METGQSAQGWYIFEKDKYGRVWYYRINDERWYLSGPTYWSSKLDMQMDCCGFPERQLSAVQIEKYQKHFAEHPKECNCCEGYIN